MNQQELYAKYGINKIVSNSEFAFECKESIDEAYNELSGQNREDYLKLLSGIMEESESLRPYDRDLVDKVVAFTKSTILNVDKITLAANKVDEQLEHIIKQQK